MHYSQEGCFLTWQPQPCTGWTCYADRHETARPEEWLVWKKVPECCDRVGTKLFSHHQPSIGFVTIWQYIKILGSTTPVQWKRHYALGVSRADIQYRYRFDIGLFCWIGVSVWRDTLHSLMWGTDEYLSQVHVNTSLCCSCLSSFIQLSNCVPRSVTRVKTTKLSPLFLLY